MGWDLNNSRGNYQEMGQTLEWGMENSSEVLVIHGIFKITEESNALLLNPWLEAVDCSLWKFQAQQRCCGSLRMFGKDNSSDFILFFSHWV